MKTAIYPGSFDPVTLGHIDVIKRASKLFDHLIIGVLNNRAKTPLFSVEERVKMLEEVKRHSERGGKELCGTYRGFRKGMRCQRRCPWTPRDH